MKHSARLPQKMERSIITRDGRWLDTISKVGESAYLCGPGASIVPIVDFGDLQ